MVLVNALWLFGIGWLLLWDKSNMCKFENLGNLKLLELARDFEWISIF